MCFFLQRKQQINKCDEFRFDVDDSNTMFSKEIFFAEVKRREKENQHHNS